MTQQQHDKVHEHIGLSEQMIHQEMTQMDNQFDDSSQHICE
jgi:hypothetical protein